MSSSSSSSLRDRERDRYPTPAQVRAFAADEAMLPAREIFSKQIDPKLTNLANYSIDAHGRAFIAFSIPMVFSDDLLQKIKLVVTKEFIATRPGWRITCFKTCVSPGDDYDDTFHDYTRIAIEEDIAHK